MAVKTLKVDLPAEIFDAQASVPLLHQVVVAQLAAARQGTHKTKNRGEVSGAGRKPFKQKAWNSQFIWTYQQSRPILLL